MASKPGKFGLFRRVVVVLGGVLALGMAIIGAVLVVRQTRENMEWGTLDRVRAVCAEAQGQADHADGQQAAEKAIKALYQHLHLEAWGHALIKLFEYLPSESRPRSELKQTGQSKTRR